MRLLPTIAGLGYLGSILAAGSVARVGFQIRTNAAYPESDPAFLQNAVEGCLYNSGAFYEVQTQFSSGWLNDYLAIQGRTTFEFSQTEDFGGYVQQVIQSCLPQLEIVKRDAVVVDSIPADQANAQGTQQPNWQDYRGTPEKPKTDCSKVQAWDDWIACQLGISTSQAVAVGVIGTLLGVVIIGKVVK